MSIISSKLYKALREANISDNVALEAAEEVANFKNDITEIKTTLKFLVGLNIAMFCTMIGVLFAIFLK